MFKFPFLTRPFSTILVGGLSLFSLSSSTPAQANVFSETPVDDDRIIAIAAPYNDGLHQLLVIQQVATDKSCWRESSAAAGPVQVDPLLAYFDFTGICGRSTDSNGYSIRLGGQDLGWRYSLQTVKQDGDLLLVGVPTNNRNAPRLTIGHVGGWHEGFVKIHLNPGWQMSQRTYLGEPLGHIYFTNNQSLAALSQPNATANTAVAPKPYGIVEPPTSVQGDRASLIVPTR
jgi:N-acetylmuramoyl-L-alanine amidase